MTTSTPAAPAPAASSQAAPRIDHFFSAVAARLDLWRDLNRAAQAWASSPASRSDAKLQAACGNALTAVLPMEDFQAYPGPRLTNALRERQAKGDAIGVARLAQRVSSALMTRSYRSDPAEWGAVPPHVGKLVGKMSAEVRCSGQ